MSGYRVRSEASPEAKELQETLYEALKTMNMLVPLSASDILEGLVNFTVDVCINMQESDNLSDDFAACLLKNLETNIALSRGVPEDMVEKSLLASLDGSLGNS